MNGEFHALRNRFTRTIYFERMIRMYVVVRRIFSRHVMLQPADNNTCDNVVKRFRFRNDGNEIVDLRKKLKALVDTKTTFCSFELLPVKNDDFYRSFFTEMSKYHPLFYSLTFHSKKATKDYLSLKLIDIFPSNTLLHLTAKDLTRSDVEIILKDALKCGITNIFALRGDSVNANGEFPHAIDLVRFIRSQFGDAFCICVAGYPEMHQESPSKELDLFYLKEKVEAGADFIITQIFFKANVFIKFVNDCKEIGINVPIIPGIYPIHNYPSLIAMMKTCNVKIPHNVLDLLESIKDNDDKVQKYGIELSTNIIRDIIESGATCGFHLFTLNRLSLISEICNKLGISTNYLKVKEV